MPTLPTSTLASSSQAPTTLPPPDHHQHHHHHHNFWSAPGFYPFYDYSLLNPFGYDPFLTDPFLGDPFLYEPQLGWFRTSDQKLQDLGRSDLERVFRSRSLEELVDVENRGWRRRRKEGKSKQRRQQRKKRKRRVDSKSAVARTKIGKLSAMDSRPKQQHKHVKGRKRQRRSLGVGSMSWNELQDWRENWGKTKKGSSEGGTGQTSNAEKTVKRTRGKKRQRERGVRPNKRGKAKKSREMQKSLESEEKVHSFLKAVADKYGTLSPVTTSTKGYFREFVLIFHLITQCLI